MAFRDIVDERAEEFELAEELAVLLTRRPEMHVAVSADFTPLEDQVIRLAREDGLGSIATPGAVERLFGWLFGVRTSARALADPRLEALRRAVVVAHHRHHLPDVQVTELRERGYTPSQVRLIEARAVGG